MAMLSGEKLLQKVFPPMLATLRTEVVGENWVYELKYDGYRAIAATGEGHVTLWTRNRLDLSTRFPHIAKTLKKIKANAVLDGEIVAFDARQRPSFQLIGSGSEKFIVFDLLWLNGNDLRILPLEARRELLELLLRRPPSYVAIAEQVSGRLASMMKKVKQGGFEGLVAKRRGSVYENRRSNNWIKLKVQSQQEFAILGFTTQKENKNLLGALLLGVHGPNGFSYAGKVGTGFSSALRTSLLKKLRAHAERRSAATNAPRMRDAIWITPRYVAQIHFTEWTTEGRLRHPAFLGLRDDKKPEECVRETVK